MSSYELPNAEEMSEFLSDLLGEDIEVEETDEPLEWNRAEAYTGAIYHHPDKTIGAGAIVDIEAIAYIASALVMNPKGIADKMIKGGVVEEAAHDAFGEVMNITAGIMNDVDPRHVKLKYVLENRRNAKPEEKDFFCKPGVQTHFKVSIPGYGEGRITLQRPRE